MQGLPTMGREGGTTGGSLGGHWGGGCFDRPTEESRTRGVAQSILRPSTAHSATACASKLLYSGWRQSPGFRIAGLRAADESLVSTAGLNGCHPGFILFSTGYRSPTRLLAGALSPLPCPTSKPTQRVSPPRPILFCCAVPQLSLYFPCRLDPRSRFPSYASFSWRAKQSPILSRLGACNPRSYWTFRICDY